MVHWYAVKLQQADGQVPPVDITMRQNGQKFKFDSKIKQYSPSQKNSKVVFSSPTYKNFFFEKRVQILCCKNFAEGKLRTL